MEKKDELIKIFAIELQQVLLKAEWSFELLQEIRLRIDKPLMLLYDGKEYFVTRDGKMCTKNTHAYIVTRKELIETMEYIGNYSLYAFEEELKQGFITIQGGHRVGIAGKTIVDRDKVRNVKYISYINVRLSHQIKGCADDVIPYLRNEKDIYHTLIISPPRAGKTTLLRDVIRQLSNGTDRYPGQTIGVVDERSEIGGSYLGMPQNDLGIRTDILDCCPKADGMMMMIRSMSPNIICVDEIGDYRDIHAIESVLHCGCRLIATVHGSSIEDVRNKPLLEKLVREHVFERYIVLHNKRKVGTVKSIFDGRGTRLYEEEMVVC